MKLLLLFLPVIFMTTTQAEDIDSWVKSKRYAKHIANLIKSNSHRFNEEFPNSTVEETENSLRILKKGLRWLKSERFSNVVLGFSEAESWQIRLFREKITELKLKRKNLKKNGTCQSTLKFS